MGKERKRKGERLRGPGQGVEKERRRGRKAEEGEGTKCLIDRWGN